MRVPISGKNGLERDISSMAIISTDTRGLAEAKERKKLYSERNHRLTNLEERVSGIETTMGRIEDLLVKVLKDKE